jgi:hypothetical protein
VVSGEGIVVGSAPPGQFAVCVFPKARREVKGSNDVKERCEVIGRVELRGVTR